MLPSYSMFLMSSSAYCTFARMNDSLFLCQIIHLSGNETLYYNSYSFCVQRYSKHIATWPT